MLKRFIAAVSLIGLLAPQAQAAPVPRFVSLRADEVNMRAGPGVRYPVEWVYKRRGLPVKVVETYDNWRKVKDAEGTTGWIHVSMLSGRRTGLVTGDGIRLRAEADGDAAAVARLERGVIVTLESCPEDGGAYCRAKAGDHAGWVTRDALWGVLSGETFD